MYGPENPPSLRVEPLELGTIEADSAEVVFGRPHGQRVKVPVYAHLILGGTAPILVDTGFADPMSLSRLGMVGAQQPEQLLERQLATHGVAMGDVGLVINTHLHLDHCGRNAGFPITTPIALDRRELEYSASGLEGPIYAAEDVKHMIDRLHTPGALWLLDLESAGPVQVAPGVTCLHAGGHTPGSLMVLVATGAGVACICGDIVYDVQDQVAEPLGQVSRDEPAPVGIATMSRRDEIAAIKRALHLSDYLMPMHDRPARIREGRVVGQLSGTVPELDRKGQTSPRPAGPDESLR